MDIAKDLLIPYRVMLEIHRLFGCSNDGTVVAIKTKRKQLEIDKFIIW